MAPDRKKIYAISLAGIAVLLLALFVPVGMGRPLAAALLLPTTTAACLFIKKRNALSLNSRTVLLLMSVIGALYLMGHYVSGLVVGFAKTGYGFRRDILLTLTIPALIIIVCTELLRYVLCAQKCRGAWVCAYFIGLLSELVIGVNLAGITRFPIFMDAVGLILLPGLLSNGLYNYLTLRYGWKPTLAFRGLTVWSFFLIPYASAIADSLHGFINILIHLAIYLFIDALFERKRRYALKENSRSSRILSGIGTALLLIFMIGTVMLVSNHFYYGAYVIATDSMNGELNRGDVAICERYEEQFLGEGQVIAFKQNKSVIVHRIADIQIINGLTRYYTKGDANEDLDVGYVTDGDIVGLVNHKLPFVGYPTLWLRSLFAR